MNHFISYDDFAVAIGKLIRTEGEKVDGEFRFNINARSTFNKSQNTIYSLSEQRLAKAVSELRNRQEFEESGLYNTTSYEILVKVESAAFRPRFDFINQEFNDRDNNISYALNYPTDSYYLYYIKQLMERGFFPVSRIPSYLHSITTGEEISDAFDLAKVASGFLSLKIETENDHKLEEFRNYVNSFFFHLSYNLDVSIVPLKNFDELFRTNTRRFRRARKIEELEAPKRTYTRELVYHYQAAISANDPVLVYLSYYHVLEHFFASITDEELLSYVKSFITSPNFSYKRNQDIKLLLDNIKAKMSKRGDTVEFNEKEALTLTLKKFVPDVAAIREKVQDHDKALEEYYRSNQVSFSSGTSVDLRSTDKQAVLQALADRIYRTRNAIVHRKDNKKGRYEPFQHNKDLLQEIPLIRSIAEVIILNTSKEI